MNSKLVGLYQANGFLFTPVLDTWMAKLFDVKEASSLLCVHIVFVYTIVQNLPFPVAIVYNVHLQYDVPGT